MTTAMAVAAKAKFLVLFIISSPLSPPGDRFCGCGPMCRQMRWIGRISANLPNRFLAFRPRILAFIAEVSSNTWNFSTMFRMTAAAPA
ncbi:hypothetical protein OLX23_19300 [Novosphingobium sp. JCM 18896]|nr:hypothetical protein [Novosphingobium sp. JCM 18896]